MPPERCLEMATINAARALGLESEIGSLEPGKLADIAIFNLNTPRAVPANNPITSLVYSARGTDAHWVFVNGRDVIREGVLTTFAEVPKLLDEVTRRSREIVGKANLAGKAKPHWPRPMAEFSNAEGTRS
jgi:5-methylthioadenosine/S-adenosylhomocysteine deaminase